MEFYENVTISVIAVDEFCHFGGFGKEEMMPDVNKNLFELLFINKQDHLPYNSLKRKSTLPLYFFIVWLSAALMVIFVIIRMTTIPGRSGTTE